MRRRDHRGLQRRPSISRLPACLPGFHLPSWSDSACPRISVHPERSGRQSAQRRCTIRFRFRPRSALYLRRHARRPAAASNPGWRRVSREDDSVPSRAALDEHEPPRRLSAGRAAVSGRNA